MLIGSLGECTDLRRSAARVSVSIRIRTASRSMGGAPWIHRRPDTLSEAHPDPSPAPSPSPAELEEQRRALQARVREAAARSPYGYFEEHPVPSTREELLERLRQGRPTPLVWTPETVGVVPAWTVPYLFEAFREHGMRHARNLVVFWGAMAAILGAAAAFGGAGTSVLLFAMLAGVLVVHSAVEYRTFRSLTPDKLRTEAREIRSRPPPPPPALPAATRRRHA